MGWRPLTTPIGKNVWDSGGVRFDNCDTVRLELMVSLSQLGLYLHNTSLEDLRDATLPNAGQGCGAPRRAD